jgi:hypothetical protein
VLRRAIEELQAYLERKIGEVRQVERLLRAVWELDKAPNVSEVVSAMVEG